MRMTRDFGYAALVVVVVAGTALAHPQSSIDATLPDNPAGVDGGLYFWSADGGSSFWQETNGASGDGMFGDAQGTGVLGLQIHNVCYGTFTPVTMSETGCVIADSPPPPGPDCLNFHHQGVCLFTYLPWGYFEGGNFKDGTEEDCIAAGGDFVPKDTHVYGQYSDLTKHFNSPASYCFPPGYGKAQ